MVIHLDKNKNYIVQSVLFKKDKFSIDEAIDWLKNNDFNIKKIDVKENWLRARQMNPNYIEKNDYNIYRMKKIDKGNIMILIAYKD